MPATRMRRARRRRACRRAERLDLRRARRRSGGPGWRRSPRSRPGSSSTVDRELQVALHVLLDRLDDRGAAGEREVEDVAARARREPHAAAARAPATPSTSTVSGAGALELLPVARDVAHRRTCQLADRAVQAHQLLRRERLGALEDLARARVGRAHLGLLLVGQAEDVEDEHLVDLAAVEEVARALGRDPRVVLEDDRRGQQRVALARLADQHRPRARVLARLRVPRAAPPAGR